MTPKLIRLVYCLILASLAGCADIATLLSPPTPAPISQSTSTPQPVQTLTPTDESTLLAARVLRLWLPPRFDPNTDTESAKLLKQRLTEFEETHPGLKIEVRLKAEEGETSLLNSLSITGVAAPSALPDLIALPRSDLEAAASKGLLHPMDGLSTLLDDPNWYPYARELGHIQNIGYGLPFAGDALVLMHQPELDITSWDDIFDSDKALLFSAGDPQALFALCLYVSAGGELVNEQGQAILEEEPLTETLTLLQQGLEPKVFSPNLLDLKKDEQAFQAYRGGRAAMVIAWLLNYRMTEDGSMQPIPGLHGTPHIFARGWSWALAGSEPENQQVATELAEYLIADDFIKAWLGDTGYIPTRFSATDEQDTNVKAILESAQVLPSNNVLAVLGPIMSQAVSRILSGEQVQVVMESVMEQFK